MQKVPPEQTKYYKLGIPVRILLILETGANIVPRQRQLGITAAGYGISDKGGRERLLQSFSLYLRPALKHTNKHNDILNKKPSIKKVL